MENGRRGGGSSPNPPKEAEAAVRAMWQPSAVSAVLQTQPPAGKHTYRGAYFYFSEKYMTSDNYMYKLKY